MFNYPPSRNEDTTFQLITLSYYSWLTPIYIKGLLDLLDCNRKPRLFRPWLG